MLTVDNEIMPFRLAGDGLVYGLAPDARRSRFRAAPAQVGIVVLAEAHIKHPGACEADAVAAFAEIIRHRCDETSQSARFADRDA